MPVMPSAIRRHVVQSGERDMMVTNRDGFGSSDFSLEKQADSMSITMRTAGLVDSAKIRRKNLFSVFGCRGM